MPQAALFLQFPRRALSGISSFNSSLSLRESGPGPSGSSMLFPDTHICQAHMASERSHRKSISTTRLSCEFLCGAPGHKSVSRNKGSPPCCHHHLSSVRLFLAIKISIMADGPQVLAALQWGLWPPHWVWTS